MGVKVAVGYAEGERVKVAVSMTRPLFNEVRLLAKEEGRSFSAQAAVLIRAGLIAVRREEGE